jgi:hypothetical protein
VCGAAVAPSAYSWDDDVDSCIMGSDADMVLFADEHSFSVVRIVVILHEDSGESKIDKSLTFAMKNKKNDAAEKHILSYW